MTSASKLIQQGRKEELWMKYCGFLDLDLTEFMEIQERLLLEQIELLGKSMMGRMLMGDVIPSSMQEFRDVVPLTTYDDYVGYLENKREDVLPRKPHTWAHTSGRSGDFRFKWVPYTKKMYDRLGEVVVGSMILATSSKKGDLFLKPNDSILLATAPSPYLSGLVSRSTQQQMDVKFLPPLDSGEQMDFRERISEGFKLGIKEGIDFFYGIPSVLVNIGEQLEQGSGSLNFSWDMLRLNVLWRFLKGFYTARIKKRNILPKDIWKVKGIMAGGADTTVYNDPVHYYWGKRPLEGYGCTEGGILAIQAWNYQGMTFFPEDNFLEFIPHEEHKKSKEDPDYEPRTLLYDELEPGIYELVFTNFHGGIFTRYRVGDLFKVVALRDDDLGINLPQVRFFSRSDDIINLAGFALLTENDLMQAIELSDVDYYEWVARKEIENNKAYLHIFLEIKSVNNIDPDQLKSEITNHLRKINPDYEDLENMLTYNALKLSLLNPGAFGAYMDYQQSQGADLAHTKPPHMKPTKKQITRLIKGRRMNTEQ